MTSTLAVSTITIDLRRIAPRECHALSIARFDAPQSGQARELVNDHDPQTLHAQFQDRGLGPYDGRCVDIGPASSRADRQVRGDPTPDAGDSCSGGACCS